MSGSILFFADSVLLGVGLAMDAFSVSLANGLNEPGMKKGKLFGIAGVFGVFQALMPLAGWICVHTVVSAFQAFEKWVPWIALALLGFIGGKMLYDGFKNGSGGEDGPERKKEPIGFGAVLIQGVATAIDALSVGFTIAGYGFAEALASSLIIGGVTFVISALGVFLGKRFGMRFAGKASVAGGVILILIGVEIFVTGVFFS